MSPLYQKQATRLLLIHAACIQAMVGIDGYGYSLKNNVLPSSVAGGVALGIFRISGWIHHDNLFLIRSPRACAAAKFAIKNKLF
jgi:hypothetical protein